MLDEEPEFHEADAQAANEYNDDMPDGESEHHDAEASDDEAFEACMAVFRAIQRRQRKEPRKTQERICEDYIGVVSCCRRRIRPRKKSGEPNACGRYGP